MTAIEDLALKLENECFRLIDALADMFWSVVMGVYDAMKILK